MINRHILEHHIDLRLNSSLREVLVDENGKAIGVKTEAGEIIDCSIVGLTAGVSPNVSFLKDTPLEIDKGIKVNRYLETNIPDVYAIGDCAQQHEPIGQRRAIEAVWYTGRMMGEVLAQTICGNKMQYNPGNWFNSAKFLDIEYQTYGWVWAKPKDNETHFYWEHASGKKAMRFAFDTKSREFLGVNTFGVRLRHEFFDTVLNGKKSVDYVIENLKKANFDPELYKHYEKEITQKFKQEVAPIHA
jgi:NADPH-dependent 2,4-dienoyl-CoA reductase/sulfur reductase-like enzyme